MTKKAVKDTEIIHPIRQYLGLSYQRWTEINGIVERTIRDSTSWGEVLTKLSEINELTGSEYILAGGMFSEKMFQKIRVVPELAGITERTIPIKMNTVGSRCAEFPIYRTIAAMELNSQQTAKIKHACNQTIGVGPHLAAKLGMVYSRLKDTASPLELTAAGFECHAMGLLEGAMGPRWVLFNEIDAEWHAVENVENAGKATGAT